MEQKKLSYSNPIILGEYFCLYDSVLASSHEGYGNGGDLFDGGGSGNEGYGDGGGLFGGGSGHEDLWDDDNLF